MLECGCRSNPLLKKRYCQKHSHFEGKTDSEVEGALKGNASEEPAAKRMCNALRTPGTKKTVVDIKASRKLRHTTLYTVEFSDGSSAVLNSVDMFKRTPRMRDRFERRWLREKEAHACGEEKTSDCNTLKEKKIDERKNERGCAM